MIREIPFSEYNILMKFVEEDVARNYFILLGLSSKKKVFDKIYGEYKEDKLRAVLFRRNSGVLQFFAPDEFDVEGFVRLIYTLSYNSMIGPKSYCDNFLRKGIFNSVKNGAYIAKLDRGHRFEPEKIQYNIRSIEISDLDEIVKLYKDTFKSFSPKEVMEEKLSSCRGRGICIEKNGEIISVAQTDFEKIDSAVIVGVATKNQYRCRGLATACLKELCNTLLQEGKDIYLQYDNLDAGKIYKRLGFDIIDQVIHYK